MSYWLEKVGNSLVARVNGDVEPLGRSSQGILTSSNNNMAIQLMGIGQLESHLRAPRNHIMD